MNNFKSNLEGIDNSKHLIVHRSVYERLNGYNALKETEYIMKSPIMMNIIRKGEKDIKEGKGIEFNQNI